MKLFSFDTVLKAFYAAGICLVLAVLVTGLPYYLLTLPERPHSDMHTQLKPAGIWGHGLGIIGTAMVLLLLLYSARKRLLMGLRFGTLRRWLDIHIFFGIMGPLLITLHTAMKFSGIVSISYFSMLAVAFSGVFGRYVYMQIPRDNRGHALGLEDARENLAGIQRALVEDLDASPEAIGAIEEFASRAGATAGSKFRGILASLRDDLTINRRARKLRRRLTGGKNPVPKNIVNQVIALARESSILRRRVVMLDSMSDLLHYWHVFHKPFAYVMLFIMVIHVGVAVAFGYTWIF
jgi:hypothetical protein